MKRSQAITLTLLAAAAAGLTGCRKTEMMRCVDDKQRIVDDAYCNQQPGQTTNTTTPGARPGFVGYYPYHWWYGGSTGGRVGDTVMGGASTPTPGTRGVSASGVSRGGFGSSMSGVSS